MGYQQVRGSRAAVDLLDAVFAADVIARVVRVVWCAYDLDSVGQTRHPAVPIPDIPVVRVGDASNSKRGICERHKRIPAVLPVVLNSIDMKRSVAIVSVEPQSCSPVHDIPGRNVTERCDALNRKVRQCELGDRAAVVIETVVPFHEERPKLLCSGAVNLHDDGVAHPIKMSCNKTVGRHEIRGRIARGRVLRTYNSRQLAGRCALHDNAVMSVIKNSRRIAQRRAAIWRPRAQAVRIRPHRPVAAGGRILSDVGIRKEKSRVTVGQKHRVSAIRTGPPGHAEGLVASSRTILGVFRIEVRIRRAGSGSDGTGLGRQPSGSIHDERAGQKKP